MGGRLHTLRRRRREEADGARADALLLSLSALRWLGRSPDPTPLQPLSQPLSLSPSILFQRFAVLGSTGSIGTQTLDIAAEHGDKFEIVALSAGGNIELLAEQVRGEQVRKEGAGSALRCARRLFTLLV